ncbi:MAG: class I SAM-dependent methyltransferase, partial [Anaerolineales bacterium]
SQATIADLPFSNAAFAGALCLGVLEYVDDLDSAVEELSRVLKDDGMVIMSMQNRFSFYRFWERHIHSGFLFNTLRKFGRRPIVDKPMEKLTSLRELKDILSRHHLIVMDALYYNFNIWLKPLDRWFPNLSVRTSRKLESLHLSMLGFLLGADFLVRVQKVLLDLETVSNMFL